MKKNVMMLAVVASILSVTSCSLDENPIYSINTTTAFNSELSAQMALDGTYGTMVSYLSYSQEFYETMVGGSGLAWGMTNGSDQDRFSSLNVLSTSRNVTWGAMYQTIGGCNAFIEGVYAGSLAQNRKDYYAAQARFIRALCYYNLLNIYGDVPLRIGRTGTGSIDMARTSKDEVAKQISADWEFAALHLSDKQSDTEISKGIPSRWAANAYLAKHYFMLASKEGNPSSENWQKAKAFGEKVLNANAYALEPKFGDLFKTGVNKSKEIIFQLNTSKLLPGGMGNRTSWLFAPSQSTTGISWGRYKSTKDFYDMFRGTYPDDPRLSETFLSQWTNMNSKQVQYAYPTIAYKPKGAKASDPNVVKSIDYSLLADPTNPTIDELNAQDTMFTYRFVNPTGNNEGWPYFKKCIDFTATAQNSGKNIIVYRYADFLLLMADIYNELGQTSDAVRLANLVIGRARLSGTNATFPKDWVEVPQAELRDRLFFERLFELAGEPEMYMEVRRRGVSFLKKVMDMHNQHHINAALINNTSIPKHNWRDRFFDVGADNLKKNLLLPIPINELNTNGLINTEGQNFGY